MIKKFTGKHRLIRLNFERTLGLHSVTTFVAYGQSKFSSEFTCFHGDNFISNTIPQLNFGNSGTQRIFWTSSTAVAGNNYFGRVNYSDKNSCFPEECFAATDQMNFSKTKVWVLPGFFSDC